VLRALAAVEDDEAPVLEPHVAGLHVPLPRRRARARAQRDDLHVFFTTTPQIRARPAAPRGLARLELDEALRPHLVEDAVAAEAAAHGVAGLDDVLGAAVAADVLDAQLRGRAASGGGGAGGGGGRRTCFRRSSSAMPSVTPGCCCVSAILSDDLKDEFEG